MKHLFTILLTCGCIISYAQNVGIGTTTPTDQLHTTGSVRFENYRGNNTRIVQIDSAGKLVIPFTGALHSNTTLYSIPDNGCPSGNGGTSQIEVTGQTSAVSSSKIAVRLNITHTYDSDLRIYLYPPSGGGVLVLAAANGGSGDNFSNTIFSDQATLSINAGTAPFAGQYKPKGGATECFAAGTPLSNFAGIGGGTIIPNGTWTLRVLDNSGADVGSLNSWSISFAGLDIYTTADENGFLPKYNSGNLNASAIYQQTSGVNTGNIGVGTTNPTEKLQVDGAIKIGGTSSLTKGTIRYTAADSSFEAYDNSRWKNVVNNFSVKGEYSNGRAPNFNSMIRNAFVELPHLRDTIKKTGNYLIILTAVGTGVDEYNALYDPNDNRSDYEGFIRVCPPGSVGNFSLIHKDLFYIKYSNPSNTTVTFEYHNSDGEKSGIVFLNAGDIIKTYGYVTQIIGPNAPPQVNPWTVQAQVKFILLN